MRFRRSPGVSSLESLAAEEGEGEEGKRGTGEGGRRGKAPQAQPWEMAGKEEETAEDERETRERKPGEGVLEA